MRARLILPVLLLAATGAWGGRALADRMGTWAGRALAEVARHAPGANLSSRLLGEPLPDDPATSADAVVETVSPAPHANTKRQASPKHVIRVSAAKVRALARRGVRPTGTPVAATDDHPAGLRLHGVGGMGIGVQDGDILTHAAGAPATSSASVVAAAYGAWQSKAHAVGATLWRRGETIGVIVEIPNDDR